MMLGPASAKARQDALAILAASLKGDVDEMTAAGASSDPALVVLALAMMLFESLSARGVEPVKWVAEQQGRPGTPFTRLN
jgi:hypothetical protein